MAQVLQTLAAFSEDPSLFTVVCYYSPKGSDVSPLPSTDTRHTHAQTSVQNTHSAYTPTYPSPQYIDTHQSQTKNICS